MKKGANSGDVESEGVLNAHSEESRLLQTELRPSAFNNTNRDVNHKECQRAGTG